MSIWTVIDEQAVHRMDVDEHEAMPLVDPMVLGWERKPEGLCRGDLCVPVPSTVAPGPIPLDVVGRMLGRPVVVDPMERVAAVGASANERAEALRSGQAPDVELPDVNGVLHRLSDHQGRKIVLYAYASW